MDKSQISEKLSEIFADALDENSIKVTRDPIAQDIDEWDCLHSSRSQV